MIESIPATGSADQEKSLGFWLYLMSDAVLFALLFATYAVLVNNTATGPTGAQLFSLGNTFISTMILLVSSLTFGMATIAVAEAKQSRVVFWLSVSALLGLAFVVLEINEFSGLIQQDAGPQRSGFLSAFFTLVGTHGLHVSVGILWIGVMLVQTMTKGLTPPVCSRISRLGLFWHFLDIVWVGIFSFVYLHGLS